MRRVITVFSFLVFAGFASPQPPKEYQVKAVFLFNFAQFVEWPSAVFASPQSPLVIGILGEDPFGNFLDDIVRGEKVNGHPLEIKRYQRNEEVQNCHILFISAAKTEKLEQLLVLMKDRKVLTVGDGNNFARSGGMIRFFTENNKIRIRINLDVAREANLTISSKLLRLAEIVGHERN